MPERYGEFEVSLMSKEKKASYVVRSFLLRHKHRKVPHHPLKRICNVNPPGLPVEEKFLARIATTRPSLILEI